MKFIFLTNASNFPALATLALGFVLGLKHALDADHLAAVSTFVSETRSPLRSSLIGIFWGLGHTAALLVFGLVIAVFRLAVTARLAQALEFLVGCMLVFLGLNALLGLAKAQTIHVHTHEHDGARHSHLHFHLGDSDHVHHHHVLKLGGKPFVVGIVHGLAGTAALMLFVLGAIPSLLLAVCYILVFGIGSIGGMVGVTLLMGVPLALAGRRAKVLEHTVRLAAGVFSLGFGVFLMWKVGLVQALLG